MTDILSTLVSEQRHAAWIAKNAAELVADYTLQDELRPHKSLYGMLTILLMWRTGADQLTARKAINLAADELAATRELIEDQEWLNA
jgi:hypothetical protein